MRRYALPPASRWTRPACALPMPTSPRQHGANFNGLEPLESRQLFTAVTFPAAEGLVFQTSGPQAGANIGDFYTSDETNSTEQAHFLFVQVTQAMLDASPSGQVTITVNDAESNEGLDEENNQDEVRDNIDPTRFRLLDSTRTQVLDPGVILAPSQQQRRQRLHPHRQRVRRAHRPVSGQLSTERDRHAQPLFLGEPRH